MKKYLILILILLVSIFPIRNIKGSDLSVLIDKLKGFTICQLKFYQAIPGMADNCARTTELYDFDPTPIVTGRVLIRSNFGCGNYFYKREFNKDINAFTGQNHDKHVALIGDSLTMFGGPSEIWDSYLGDGAYHVLNMGAAGSTSSAWKEHFETCIFGGEKDPWIGLGQAKPPNGINEGGGYGRPQMPPRSIMMIGGNDFHSYKGMLQAMWWAVPFRRLNTVYNIEKLITYHHQVNDGCGDYFRVTENGKKRLDPDNPRRKNPDGSCIDKDGDGNDYKDWGIGRLFVLLGNIPAVWV
ncbi:MAG: hypothetical protein KDK90_28745 [Leptospiraceae bacterium]|nr:hypothetical protein [Leptospiraceae bacterium]